LQKVNKKAQEVARDDDILKIERSNFSFKKFIYTKKGLAK
jgi:hypothetical protein